MGEEEARAEGSEEESGRRTYPVIGIGAGSTASDELRELLGGLQLASVATIVVEHISPERERAITEALRDDHGDKVVDIEDGTGIEPGKIFVVSGAAEVAVFHGTFHVMPLSAAPRTPRLPIDFFLRALAADQGESAIGVILAGTAPDGTFGLQAVKAEGGITFVQDHAGGN